MYENLFFSRIRKLASTIREVEEDGVVVAMHPMTMMIIHYSQRPLHIRIDARPVGHLASQVGYRNYRKNHHRNVRDRHTLHFVFQTIVV